jgi:PKD repeat protein
MKMVKFFQYHKVYFLKGIVLIFLLSDFTFLIAQAPVANFALNPSACIGENLNIQNTSQNATSYFWRFCKPSLENVPAATGPISLTGANLPLFMSTVQDGSQWFGFVSNLSGGIQRLNFGNDLRSTPVVTTLGNLGSPLFNNPRDLKLLKENNNWFALVVNQGNNNLIRLSFGSSLNNIPSVELVSGVTGLERPISLNVVTDNDNTFVVVSNNDNDKLTVFNLGSSVQNSVQQIMHHDLGLSPVNGLYGLDLRHTGTKWIGVLTNAGQNKIVLLDFGNSLVTTPSVQEVSGIGGVNVPLSARIQYDLGNYYILIISENGSLVRMNMGPLFSFQGSSTNYGNFSALNFTSSLDIISVNNDNIAFTINYTTGQLYQLVFDGCNINNPVATETEPGNFEFPEPGTYEVTLTAFGSGGTVSSKTQALTVQNLQAPDVLINSENMCEDHDIHFTVQSLSNNIITYDWDFGDASAHGLTPDPTHVYTDNGPYTTILKVSADNGCNNITWKTLQVYEPPQASFISPAGLICSNNELTFENTTAGNYDGNLMYQWYIDDEPVSDEPDLNFIFSTTETKSIKLITSIPGCSDEEVQSISATQTGPIVDFSFTGRCEDDNVQFVSNINQSVISYDWQFSNGGSSTNEAPVHVFGDIGNYTITLSAVSSNGCNNSTTKPITIYAKPTVDFKIDPPPQACSGSTTAFIDLTIDPADSDLQSWQWNFGDAGAGNTAAVQNPSHTYANAGMYTVSLTATTDAGCSASWEEQITISQSPAVTIGNSPTCVGVPVNFSATGSDIQSYYWELGTLYYEVANPVHTFNATGNQSVKLTIQGNNNCITVYNRSVTVPVVLSPDFSVTDNCTGFDAVFTDITTGADPVVQRTWDFAGLGTSSDQPASFEFASTGNKNIKLTVTTQAGCSYSKNKTISVVTPPVAAFTASPESGGTPLLVQFTNTSTASTATTKYTWTIDDGSIFTTDQVSPTYTFAQTGLFLVTLVASVPQGCESFFMKNINTTVGLPDVDLKLITTSENADGTIKVIITVQNKGNTVLRNLPVVIDISGNVSLTETIAGPISPASMYNLVLGYGLSPNENLKFLCAETTLENDQTPEGNRICKEFDDAVFLFNAYPNPAKGLLTIEWIAPKDEVITISLVDSSGKKIVLSEVNSLEGLNSSRLSLDNIKNGLYILRIQGASLLKTQRIFVSGQN